MSLLKVHYLIMSNFTLAVVKIQVSSVVKPVLSFCVCHCAVKPMCKNVMWSVTLLMSDINKWYKINCTLDIFIMYTVGN